MDTIFVGSIAVIFLWNLNANRYYLHKFANTKNPASRFHSPKGTMESATFIYCINFQNEIIKILK